VTTKHNRCSDGLGETVGTGLLHDDVTRRQFVEAVRTVGRPSWCPYQCAAGMLPGQVDRHAAQRVVVGQEKLWPVMSVKLGAGDPALLKVSKLLPVRVDELVTRTRSPRWPRSGVAAGKCFLDEVGPRGQRSEAVRTSAAVGVVLPVRRWHCCPGKLSSRRPGAVSSQRRKLLPVRSGYWCR